ncbi:MAG: NAD+ synthase [Chitinivibrionales bacterium]|nr:NAD+ synthase [Chitinivibrionales bacterium]
MRIALCQLNSIAGDIEGNTRKIIDSLDRVGEDRADLVVFSELFIQGYPPRDLLENRWFIDQTEKAIHELCAVSRKYPNTGILTGAGLPGDAGIGKKLSNAALLIYNGSVVFRQDKSLLPTYDVFDEDRYFDPASSVHICEFKGEKLGVTICEDAWNSEKMWHKRKYDQCPVELLAKQGATLMINISGSPYFLGKQQIRYSIMQGHARKNKVPFIFLNQIGGNDELIFDGSSLYFDAQGELLVQLPSFEEEIRLIDTGNSFTPKEPENLDTLGGLHDALLCGLRDYVHKCGFEKVLVGLSGGIDSAVTCALAVAALGGENVAGVTMPSRYSSEGSVADSKELAENLGIEFSTIPIENPFAAFLEVLEAPFAGTQPGVAEENLQARVRGNILMALSNKFGKLLLATGNKSELAVGYCTLYGDMNGGLSVISDLPKTTVYRLARYINRERETIPIAIIDKIPSAELAPDQKDQDTLPPYEILDHVLQLLIEEHYSRKEIIDRGFNADMVDWIIRAIKRSEYKRRQAAPGLKVTPKAFGSGRRFPVAARYQV